MDLMTITKREKWHKFYPVALDGSNYLTWRLDCISYLTAAGADFVIEENEQDIETTTNTTTTRQRRTNINTDITQEQEIPQEKKKLIANARNIINDQNQTKLHTSIRSFKTMECFEGLRQQNHYDATHCTTTMEQPTS
jgi:hypothetical protein